MVGDMPKQLDFEQIAIESLPLFSGTPMWEPESKAKQEQPKFEQGDLFKGEKKQEVNHD